MVDQQLQHDGAAERLTPSPIAPPPAATNAAHRPSSRRQYCDCRAARRPRRRANVRQKPVEAQRGDEARPAPRDRIIAGLQRIVLVGERLAEQTEGDEVGLMEDFAGLKRRRSPSARASGEVGEAWSGAARAASTLVELGLVVVHRALGERIAVCVDRDQRARRAVERDPFDAGEIEPSDRRLDGADPRGRTARAPGANGPAA